jgi:hypothetical protein
VDPWRRARVDVRLEREDAEGARHSQGTRQPQEAFHGARLVSPLLRPR